MGDAVDGRVDGVLDGVASCRGHGDRSMPGGHGVVTVDRTVHGSQERSQPADRTGAAVHGSARPAPAEEGRPTCGAAASVPDLAAHVRGAAPRLGSVRLVCIDGPAGSGKTTLASRLAEQLRATVVHLDDLYEGWSGLDGVWERLEQQVLDPLSDGRTGAYQRYDWTLGAFAEWCEVPVPAVLVVEGCGSAPRALADRAVLVVWVDAPADVRLRRGLERDGEAMREQWLRWMGLEAVHFARERTRERADVVVDGCAEALP